MELKELAKALGMPEDSTLEQVIAAIKAMMAKLAEREKSADEKVVDAEKKVETAEAVATSLAKQLPAHGMKLSGDGKTIVKSEPFSAEIKDDDSEQVRELKRTIAESRLHTGKARIESAKTLATKFIGQMKLVPPAQQEALTRLLTAGDRAEALSLSADGQSIERKAFDQLRDLTDVLESIPVALGLKGLARLSPDAGEKKEKEEALSTAQKIARRALGRKEPAKT